MEMSKEEADAHAAAWNLSVGVVDSFVLKCAIETGIAKVIHDRHGAPITLTQLAASLSPRCTNLDVLRRLMGYLEHMKIFAVERGQKEESYTPTLLAKFFVTEDEKSLAAQTKALMHEECLKALNSLWACMQDNLSTSAFEWPRGENPWAFDSKHGGPISLLKEGSASSAGGVFSAWVEGGNAGEMFEGVDSLVDVGGSTGMAARSIVKAFPRVKCTVLYLPDFLKNAPRHPQVKFLVVAGDIFSASIPEANASVLDEWGDDKCVELLKKCRGAIGGNGGKVIIVTNIIGRSNPPEYERVGLALDMMKMAVTGGKERTQSEWTKLLSKAGFSSQKTKTTHIQALLYVIEAFP